MPIVMRLGGLRVVVYPNDHRPAHVHVIGGGAEAAFDLNCPDGPPAIRENYGFGRSEAARIEAALADALRASCKEWRRIHGET
jgi:hypothetical protein